jgi:MFS family permease
MPSLITAVFVLIATGLSIYMIDKVGRRKIFFLGIVGMILSLVATGVFFAMSTQLGGNLKYFALVSILLYNSFFAFSLAPLGWLIISEIFPLKVRGAGMSIGSVTNWLVNAIVAFTFFKLVNSLSLAGAFWIYALVGVGALIWGYYFIPETKGVTLERIEEQWREGKKPREIK